MSLDAVADWKEWYFHLLHQYCELKKKLEEIENERERSEGPGCDQVPGG